MRASSRRGPGPSHVLLTADRAGNVVGVDPHKQTVTATVVDPRGGIVASDHFRVSGDGHRALEAWARQCGPIARWGVEGASGWGRHTAIFLIGRGYVLTDTLDGDDDVIQDGDRGDERPNDRRVGGGNGWQ